MCVTAIPPDCPTIRGFSGSGLQPGRPGVSRGGVGDRFSCRGVASSQREQVLDQVVHFFRSETQAKERIIVFDNVEERRETAVVVKATFQVSEQAAQRGRAISPVGDRSAWEASIPISSGLCRFQPGSVNKGDVWQVEHFALFSKSVLPRSAADSSKLPLGGTGADMSN